MAICTSNLINWKISFKFINCDPFNCDLGQRVVKGGPFCNKEVLITSGREGAASGCVCTCRYSIWLRPEILVGGGLGPGCVRRCGCCVWLCPENLESTCYVL